MNAAVNRRRVALVTGAASGIGLAVATQFVRSGLSTVVLDRSAEIHAVAERLGGGCVGVVADVGRTEQIEEAMRFIELQNGCCDILVNNAGIHPKHEGRKFRIEEIHMEQWAEVLAINLTAPFLFSKLAMALMRPRQWGRIVNIASRAARTISPVAAAHYTATKTGLVGLTRVLAFEGGEFNITANCVAPGPVESRISAANSAEVRAELVRSTPLRRYGQPDEVASTVKFLVSDASAFTTGAVFDVNGGTYMP